MYVGIVGASNVGKSTLFNRLIRQFRAIVTDIHGTTKDILTETVKIQGVPVTFADSPGLHTFTDELPFIEKIVSRSDCIFFVLDHKSGLTAKEEHIHKYILQQGARNKVILVLNKVEKGMSPTQRALLQSEYYTLGYETVIDISAKTGRNLDEIRDIIVGKMQKMGYALEENNEDEDEDDNEINEIQEGKEIEGEKIQQDEEEESNEDAEQEEQEIEEHVGYIPIAIVGKPNAGKSTLLNTLAKEYVSKVEEIPGTTLDYIKTSITFDGENFMMYDTAGIRKKSKSHGIEEIAYQKTLSMLKYVKPAVLFLIDGIEGLSQRDMSLLDEINGLGLPMVIGVNKTDALDTKRADYVAEYIKDHVLFVKHVPITIISGATGKGLRETWKNLHTVREASHRKIGTSELNRIISKEFVLRPPRFAKNKICKIMYITQTHIHPPTFQVFVNHKIRANFSFKRRLENTIRKHYPLEGTALRFRRKERQQKEKETEEK